MAIQSLDELPRGELETVSSQETIILLVGTRNGDILKLEYKPNSIRDKFAATVISKNHSTQDLADVTLDKRYLRMAMHPQLSIMATVGRDKTLCIWNLDDKSIMERYFLGANHLPTCLKYNPDGTILCVGFQDGTTKLYQSKITEIEYKREANGKLL